MLWEGTIREREDMRPVMYAQGGRESAEIYFNHKKICLQFKVASSYSYVTSQTYNEELSWEQNMKNRTWLQFYRQIFNKAMDTLLCCDTTSTQKHAAYYIHFCMQCHAV